MIKSRNFSGKEFFKKEKVYIMTRQCFQCKNITFIITYTLKANEI